MADLFDRLKAECAADWHAYTDHAFVRGLADGSLPEAAFRHYLTQDYLFLIHFARAFALAGYKAKTLDDIKRAKEGISAIVDVELSLHLSYCEKWGIGPADLTDLPEAVENMAYTRYVLERGMAGDLLDLHIALAPCMLGYGEIGKRLAADPATRRVGNPYLEWIEMYAGEECQNACAEEREYIASLADGIGEARFNELSRCFRDATRLEIGFWQMGLDAVRT
ncbi:thiaminase II [Rhodospirillaceae bacterium KN72]|uniref:Aminopyrimidine aminohydrolase n=1 Tax=Pacificispira spongiicola TaxID=2729598 RepID=A0A7Y0HE66_9PROT|nr:thiaminase II [Pacificispira spongiicola]NMM43208.1 thiaminase II [Pacificispira spongiicola]